MSSQVCCVHYICVVYIYYKNNFISFNFNTVITGDVTKGELGFAAIPGEEENFKKSIEKTIEYAKALDCKMSVYSFIYKL